MLIVVYLVKYTLHFIDSWGSLPKSRDSSVGIATGYGLDGQDSIRGRHNSVSFLHVVQTVSGVHPTSYPCNRPWRPIGLWDVEAPAFSLDNRLTDGGKVVSLTRRPPFKPPGRFLVLISVRGWVDPRTTVRLEELGKLKQSTSWGSNPWPSSL
jgi:hypothetical protein